MVLTLVAKLSFKVKFCRDVEPLIRTLENEYFCVDSGN